MTRCSLFILTVLPGLLVGCGSDAPIERPQPLYGEDPIDYPLEMWDGGIEGEATLRVRVTSRGVVDSVEVVTSSGHPALDSAAVTGIAEMRFRAARRGERRIDAWATVPIHFTQRPRTGAGRRP